MKVIFFSMVVIPMTEKLYVRFLLGIFLCVGYEGGGMGGVKAFERQ